MKIVVLDRPLEKPGELDWSALHDLADEVVFYDHTDREEAAARMADADVVLLNKAPVTAGALRACPKLRFISVIATGYNTVDVSAAAALGIPVSNVPSYGSEAIGQHAVALLLEITDHVAHHDAEVRRLRRHTDRDWCFWDYPSIELAHKTMGIIGMGRIARTTAAVARALGMRVIAFDTHPTPEGAALAEYVDLATLYAESDVVCLHCPLFEENRHMINRDSLAQMKPGAILINNSRGGLVDDAALAEALASGRLYAAGLDTVEVEPIAPDNPLLSAPNVFITPHISWAALECRRRLKDTAIDNVRAFLSGAPVNVVNAPVAQARRTIF